MFNISIILNGWRTCFRLFKASIFIVFLLAKKSAHTKSSEVVSWKKWHFEGVTPRMGERVGFFLLKMGIKTKSFQLCSPQLILTCTYTLSCSLLGAEGLSARLLCRWCAQLLSRQVLAQQLQELSASFESTLQQSKASKISAHTSSTYCLHSGLMKASTVVFLDESLPSLGWEMLQRARIHLQSSKKQPKCLLSKRLNRFFPFFFSYKLWPGIVIKGFDVPGGADLTDQTIMPNYNALGCIWNGSLCYFYNDW